MDYEKIGQNIDEIRKARNWTKTALAKKMNASEATIHTHIKTGKMSLDSLVRYAEVLGCSIGDLTDGTTNIEDFHLDTDILAYYPYNLAVAVGYGYLDARDPEKMEEARQMAYSIYVPAIIESLETLTEREQKVIRLRFQSGLTYEQAGKHFNVTRERIRQVEAKAIRKLRHPRHWKHWKKDTMDKMFEVAEDRDRLRLENMELKSRLTKIMDAMGMKEEQKQRVMDTKEKAPDVSLDELELSVRSYNCLKRAGITKLSDFEGWTTERLMKVRNLGRKSMEEVLYKLREHGVEISAEETL